MIKVGSLFSGIGGIEKGFINSGGFDISWANEIDKKACETYRNNFTHKLFEDDLKNLDPKSMQDIDVLTGGFPCQAFSVAGYQKGFSDSRGNVFFEILRFLDVLKPSVIFLENVKNLTSHNSGKTFETVKNELKKRGYYLKYKILNSSEYGNIPQNRERVYIVGFRNKEGFERFEFPNPIKLTVKISDLLEDNVCDKYYYNSSKYYAQLKKEVNKSDALYQIRRVYIRENKSKLCPTLTANMGTGGHNVPILKDRKGIRKLTPKECSRFQGFDDSFMLNGMSQTSLYKQIGNSVTVPVVKNIAEQIKKAID